jgi:hypothetical protein
VVRVPLKEVAEARVLAEVTMAPVPEDVAVVRVPAEVAVVRVPLKEVAEARVLAEVAVVWVLEEVAMARVSAEVFKAETDSPFFILLALEKARGWFLKQNNVLKLHYKPDLSWVALQLHKYFKGTMPVPQMIFPQTTFPQNPQNNFSPNNPLGPLG